MRKRRSISGIIKMRRYLGTVNTKQTDWIEQTQENSLYALAIQDLLHWLLYILDKDRPVSTTILVRKLRRMRKEVAETNYQIDAMRKHVSVMQYEVESIRDEEARKYEQEHYRLAKESAIANKEKRSAIVARDKAKARLTEVKDEAKDNEKRLKDLAKIFQPILQPELDKYIERTKNAEKMVSQIAGALGDFTLHSQGDSSNK